MDLVCRRVDDLPEGHLPAHLPGHPGRRAARVRALDRRLRHHARSPPADDDLPAVGVRREPPRHPARGQRARHADLPVALVFIVSRSGPAAGRGRHAAAAGAVTLPHRRGGATGRGLGVRPAAVGAAGPRPSRARARRYRLYSDADLEQLRGIRRMRQVDRLNAPGIRRVLRETLRDGRRRRERVDGRPLRRLRHASGPEPARGERAQRPIGQLPLGAGARRLRRERRHAPAADRGLRHDAAASSSAPPRDRRHRSPDPSRSERPRPAARRPRRADRGARPRRDASSSRSSSSWRRVPRATAPTPTTARSSCTCCPAP